tara:strand:- start:821 stop:1186 length:366 start_codon:yes stop_codon:yes gene_type:complete
MIPLINTVGKLVGTWLEGRVAKTKAKAEAEATVLIKQAESAADWEAQMARNSGQSWKDEWLTLLFSIPLILCFIPSMVPYVRAGFEVLETMPDFYQYTLSVIVAASFGVRSVIGIMNKRKA